MIGAKAHKYKGVCFSRPVAYGLAMEWRFGEYSLNASLIELNGPNGPIPVEKLVFNVLLFLLENADRVVTRDELIETVWDGRIVSESTISTVIKQVRKAVGDDGSKQAVIRTLHGRGFRFVAPVHQKRAAQPKTTDAPDAEPAEKPIGTGRPSLAVQRFSLATDDQTASGIATALPAEIISSLSRMRWLHMISRGSSFQFDPKHTSPEEIGRRLGVRYLVTGLVERAPNALHVTVELLTTADGVLVWSNRYELGLSEVQLGRDEIVSSIISALDLEIPRNEARASKLLTAAEFDAWSHFHIGLSHIFRFEQQHNHIASEHFDAALALDPEFSRAHSGKSFVHWQNAFMNFGEDRAQLINKAVEEADQAILLDPNDPFAAFNQGRVRWLEGDLAGGVDWLSRSLMINPNSAQSHYNTGLLQLLSGEASEGLSSSKTAMSLSPLDPLNYAMLSTQSMAALVSEDFENAAALAGRAVQSPGAHFYIKLIAAVAHECAGHRETAAKLVQRARAQRPDASVEMFFRSFPFARPEDRRRISAAFASLGLD